MRRLLPLVAVSAALALPRDSHSHMRGTSRRTRDRTRGTRRGSAYRVKSLFDLGSRAAIALGPGKPSAGGGRRLAAGCLMELGGLEPPTSWVLYRPNDVT